MELRHLRYFIAVAEEQNVTRAAARLHLSQPPLTRQIQDLEEELGVALFERHGKSIRLTEAGEVFLEEARACLERVDQAVKIVRGKRHIVEFHLGYAPSPSAEILPGLIRKFGEVAPAARVILHDLSSPEMLSGLRQRRLQAALMMEPAKRLIRGIAFQKLRLYPVGIAVRPKSHLAARRRIRIEELIREPIVAYSHHSFPDYHEFLRIRLGGVVTRLDIVEECDSGGSLVAAVESGKGICISASFLTAAVGHRLRFIPFDPPVPQAVVGVAYLTRSNSPAVRSFLQAASSP